MEYRSLELALPAVVSHVLPPKKVQRIAGGPRHEMREMPRSLTGTNTGSFATHAHRIAPNQDNLELSSIRERGVTWG